VKRRLTRPIAIAAVALLAVAGGGIAYAATSGGNPRDALLNDAAQRLNVSPDKLRSALQGAFGDQLDQAVKAGKLTQQQADAIKQRMQQNGDVPPLGGPGAGPHVLMRVEARGVGLRAGLKATANYLGLKPAQLLQQLQSGKSLADVAKAQGKDVKGLEDAIVAAVKARLDRAVTKGHITSAQRDKLLQGLQQHIADLVNAKGPGPLCGPGMMRGGLAGPGGPPRLWRGDRQGSSQSGSPNAPGSFEGAPPPAPGFA
jgi:hypothetical protein